MALAIQRSMSFIERDFITDDSKTLFIVDNKDDVKQLAAKAQKLLERRTSFYLEDGVSGMDTEFILENMNP